MVCTGFWVVCDANGKIQKLKIADNKTDFEIETLLDVNAGRLNDIITSPI